MKTLCDCETTLVPAGAAKAKPGETESEQRSAVVIYTTAVFSEGKQLLRVEQRCTVPSSDVTDEPGWAKPRISIEFATGTEKEMAMLVEGFHQRYVSEIQGRIADSG